VQPDSNIQVFKQDGTVLGTPTGTDGAELVETADELEGEPPVERRTEDEM